MLNDGLLSSATDEWETPQDFFNKLNDEFHFTLDVCATKENAKCNKFYTKYDNGLSQDWTGEIVWCNPPYGRHIQDWVRKCYDFYRNGGTSVMLIPARTDTSWFHQYIYQIAQVRFVRGRIKFSGNKWNAPFPSMIVIYKGDKNAST